MKSFSSLLLLASVAPLASAHYVFSKFIVNGAVSKDFEYIRRNTNGYMPTLAGDILSNDFRCNQGSMAAAASTKVYTVAPGTEIGFQLAYGASMKHPGPLQVYMSKAPGDVKQYDGSGDWFKVYQEGVCSDISDGLADTDWCTWGKDTVKFKIPADMPPGQYLVRVEHIGLHRGFSGNAEFYFTCAQIEVTGSGTGKPAAVAKIPGIYQPSDPNVHFNIYYPKPTSYQLPGPAVWVEGKGGAAAQPAPSAVETKAPAAPAVTSAVKAPAESKTTAAAPAQTTFATACKPDEPAETAAASEVVVNAPAAGAIKKYFQCGGINWTGSGACESGTTCKQWNPYYHQCV